MLQFKDKDYYNKETERAMRKESKIIWGTDTDKYCFDFIKESPYTINSYMGNYLDNKRYNNDFGQEIKQTYNLIDTFDNVGIYSNPEDQEEWYFVDGANYVIGHFLYKQYKNFIELLGLWNRRENMGFFRLVFINYILPKFKTIISDMHQTPEGNKFWKKIINYGLINNIDVGLYYFKENKFVKINSMNELNNPNIWNDENIRLYIKRNQ